MRTSLPLSDGISHHCSVVDTLIQLRVEDLEGLVGVIQLSEAVGFCRKVGCGYPCIVTVEVSVEDKYQGDRVPGEGVIEGLQIVLSQHCEQFISESNFDRPALVILMPLLIVLTDDPVLFPCRCLCGDIGVTDRVGRADKLCFSDGFILGWQEDKSQLDVLDPSKGGLNGHVIIHRQMMVFF